jgi:hypothetical protein
MAEQSPAEIAQRSFAPEAELIAGREAEALYLKFACEQYPDHDTRQTVIADPEMWELPSEPPLSEYEPYKRVGSIAVEHGTPSRFAAIDTQDLDNSIAPLQENLIFLHIGHFAGAVALRRDIARTAEYIDTHDALRTSRLVAGATHEPMAQFAERAGMRRMMYWGGGNMYLEGLTRWHRIFNAFNGRSDPLKVGVVYLPTTEFINRFNR